MFNTVIHVWHFHGQSCNLFLTAVLLVKPLQQLPLKAAVHEHFWKNYTLSWKKVHELEFIYFLYLDRVGRQVSPEVCTIWVVQHCHQGESIPQQTFQLVDVLGRGGRLAQGELWLDTTGSVEGQTPWECSFSIPSYSMVLVPLFGDAVCVIWIWQVY